MDNKNYREIWNNCLNIIKDNVPSISFRTWFEPIVPIRLENNIFNNSGSKSFLL
jgi:chromosomal replication initiator protein